MAELQLSSVLRCLRQRASTSPGGELTDRQLLSRFGESRDEAAFAVLLQRHGRLVWSVCRHVLGNEQDAEDAFQAAFLILARKAGAIRKPESLASWLHGVAHRVALKARGRRGRQSLARPTPPAEPSGPVAEAALREVQAILDDEVRLLPEKLREPFVLCCLEGRSKTEAARQLGCPEGTVSGRLAQARERLRRRLARRGVALTAALTATAVAEGAVPAALSRAAFEGAVAGAAAGSSGAVILAEGVMQVMFVNKLRRSVFLLFLLCVGVGWMAHAMPAAPPAPGGSAEEKKDTGPPQRKPALAPAQVDALGDPLPPGALARLGTVRLRHTDIVTGVGCAPDGSFVAAASQDGTVRLWNPSTGKERACLRGHTGAVQSLALARDGKTLASGGKDATICLWDVTAKRTEANVRRLTGHKGYVMTVAFTPDGKTLVSGAWDGGIRVWDVKSGKELRSFGEGQGKLRSLALAADGKTLASANFSGDINKESAAINLWNLPGGKYVRTLVGDQKTIWHIAFSPDGRTLASGSDDGVKVWEVASGKLIVKLRGSGGYTPCVIFSPDGRTLLAGGGGFLREWRLPTGREVRSFDVGGNYTYAAAFSADGKTLATGGTRCVTLWNVATGKPRHTFGGHFGDVTRLVFTADGKELLSGGAGRSIYRWQAANGRQVNRLVGPLNVSSNSGTFVLSPDGRTLAALGRDLAVVLLDATTGRERVRFTKHLPPRTSAATDMSVVFTPDGKTVFSATAGIDYHIRHWDATTGKEILAIPVGKGGTSGLAVAPDGKTLYSASRLGPVRVWEVATGKELRQIGKPGEGATRLVLSADGRRLAALLAGRMCVWDTATGRELGSFPRPQGFFACLAFAPDGGTLAVAGNEDRWVRFWEVASGQVRLELGTDGAAVRTLAFSPDGRLFATGNGDTTALVWDYRALPLLGKPAGELSPQRLDELFAALSNNDAKTAFRAVCVLAQAPKQTVPFLAGRLGLRPVDAKTIERLLAQLDNDRYAVREKAMAELTALGPAVEGTLRKALVTSRSPDLRLRVGVILRRLTKGTAESRRLGDVRTLEVLEAVGTAEARRLVEELARGTPEAERTQEAKAALKRMRPKRKASAAK